mmetsp:Transcript_11445/g.31807  ORF Transcript_11445/g.31807 Transcript_11445/m.31807 type:complete len:238 (+) Transcript_11445:1411-2124(+)
MSTTVILPSGALSIPIVPSQDRRCSPSLFCRSSLSALLACFNSFGRFPKSLWKSLSQMATSVTSLPSSMVTSTPSCTEKLTKLLIVPITVTRPEPFCRLFSRFAKRERRVPTPGSWPLSGTTTAPSSTSMSSSRKMLSSLSLTRSTSTRLWESESASACDATKPGLAGERSWLSLISTSFVHLSAISLAASSAHTGSWKDDLRGLGSRPLALTPWLRQEARGEAPLGSLRLSMCCGT